MEGGMLCGASTTEIGHTLGADRVDTCCHQTTHLAHSCQYVGGTCILKNVLQFAALLIHRETYDVTFRESVQI